jgi:hypothetical protein
MSPQERNIIQEIAAKLERLRDKADAEGQHFLAYLIEMTRVEAVRPGGQRNSVLQ